jgi:hypothetical protein
MKILKILDWPDHRFYSETHPFHKWKRNFSENGISIKYYNHHLDNELQDSDCLILHSRYFDRGKNKNNGLRIDQKYLISYLTEIRRTTNKLIWFDAADSTGSSDFSIIPYVDVFLKKQVLKDLNYYKNPDANGDLRIWLNESDTKKAHYPFQGCPADQLNKIRLGWNIGLNDYRYFGYKLSRLSNYLSYGLYPLKFTDVTDNRKLDLTFRGTIHKEINDSNIVMKQRNTTLKFLGQLKMNVASGSPVSKLNYWGELRNSKLSVSPYGWGEICYRDFETFIAGALLIKPKMDHLITYPDLFKPFESYVPVSWDMEGLSEALEYLNTNYTYYKEIASNGQELYRKAISDGNSFVNNFLKAIA